MADSLVDRHDDDWKAPDIFGALSRDKYRCAPHHRSLASYARHDYAKVPSGLALTGTEHVIDAGGGLGTLSVAILENYPKARVTLLDRSEVIELTHAQFGDYPRLTLRRANLFEPWGVRADAVLLARVLHDWDDADAVRILQRARAALPKGGRIFVVEMLLNEDNEAGSLCDLHLLMATGGRERTQAGYRQLLEHAGFALVKEKRLTSLTSILEGAAK